MQPGPRTRSSSSLLERWGYGAPRNARGRLAELVIRGVVYALWMLVALGCVLLMLTVVMLGLDATRVMPWDDLQQLVRLLTTTPLGLAASLLGMAASFLLGVVFGRVYMSEEVAQPGPPRRRVSTFAKLVLNRITNF